jgi:DNA-binding LacI/PurR family transcriptional regulator
MSHRRSGDLTPTMRDVAEAAGVSKALVSIIFRRAPGASEETRARVLAVADEIGYRANRTASLLASRRTKHLGVTMNVRNAFHAELVEGIQAAADEAGYEIVLSAVGARHDEARAVATLLEFRCESVILLGSDLPQEALEQLAATIPVILVGRRAALDNLDVVRTADGQGQSLLIDHLVELGHRSIAHVDGGPGLISADRRRGYRAAMRRHRLPATVVAGGSSENNGVGGADSLLRLAEFPTAVTVFNDHCALGVIGRLAARGIEVPGRISIAGFDNSPVAQFATVNLTTVSQEAPIQAAWAVRAAVQRLEEGRDTPQEWILTPSLLVRGTTAPPPELNAQQASLHSARSI